MDCRHLADSYEIYLLGALDRGEQEELHQHVRQGCDSCRDELREAAETLYWLLQNVAPVRPSPAIKARLVQRLTPNRPRKNVRERVIASVSEKSRAAK
jgi:anti-sigma-K factor RskA